MVDYAGRKILVTGGTGFVGGRLAERLVIEEQARVRVLVRDWRKAVWVSRVNVELVHGDVRDAGAVAQAMQGCDIVFHCVGVGGPLDHCLSINYEGTRNVLECAANARVGRVVYLSTCGVHGPNPPENMDENEGFHPTSNPYNDSKIAAEEIAWQYWRDRRLPLVVIRPFPVWGPRSPAFTLWPIKHIKSGRWFVIDGGKGTCQAVYIDNLIDSLLLAGIHPEAAGEAFLIDDDNTCTWGDFFNSYARMLGRTLPSRRMATARAALRCTEKLDGRLATLQELPPHEPVHTILRAWRKGLGIVRRLPEQYTVFSESELTKYTFQGKVNTSKARRILKYKSRYTLQQGMRETETWLRDQRII